MEISENHNQLEYMWFVVNWSEQGEQEGKKKYVSGLFWHWSELQYRPKFNWIDQNG